MKSTIKSSADISIIFSQGKRVSTPFMTILLLKQNEHDHEAIRGRVAFVAGKKSGNAVWRNAAKRRMRAIWHDLGLSLPDYAVVFVARGSILKPSYSKVLESCRKALSKADL